MNSFTVNNAAQPDFFSLFAQGNQENTPVQSPTVQEVTKKRIAVPIAKNQKAGATVAKGNSSSLTFITRAQREVMRNNPFVQFFSQMNYADVLQLEKSVGENIYRLSGENDTSVSGRLYAAFQTVMTILTAERYEAVDSRFTSAQTGTFAIIEDDGAETSVEYEYSPYDCYVQDNQQRTSFPYHRISFRTAKASIVSETGFYTHPFKRVPFEEVANLGELVVKVLREERDIQETIIFEGKIYEPANADGSGAVC